jgi:Cytochrome c oxidase assembly factor 3
MSQPVPKRRNLRTGLLLAIFAIAVFAYTIWATMHNKM